MRHSTPVLALAAMLAAAAVLIAGPLTPPPGPPASTPKTLNEVEPRIPISSLPAVINAPGSYYLTANLFNAISTSDSITIGTPNVTLDLNGFVLSGGAFAIAVNAGGAGGSVTITNGTIRGASSAINANIFGGDGSIPIIVRDVRFQNILGTAIITQSNALIERCTFRSVGTAVLAGTNATIRDCITIDNRSAGFDVNVGSTIERSVASFINSSGAGATGFVLRPGSSASRVIAHNVSTPPSGLNLAVFLDSSSSLRDSNIFNSHFGVTASSGARVDGVSFHALSGIPYSTNVSSTGATIENSLFTAANNAIGFAGNSTANTVRNNIIRGTTINPNPNTNVGIGINVTPGATATITGNLIGNINRAIALQSSFNTVHSNTFNLVGSNVSGFAAGSAPAGANLIGPINAAAAATTSQSPLVNLLF